MDLYHALFNLNKINKQEKIEALNLNMISTAAGMGDKNASRKARQMSQDLKKEEASENKREILRKGVPKKSTPMLSTEDIMKLAEGAFTNGNGPKRTSDPSPT